MLANVGIIRLSDTSEEQTREEQTRARGWRGLWGHVIV